MVGETRNSSFSTGLLPRADSEVLDLACGTGALTVPLHRPGRKLTGLDASEDMLQVAVRRAALARKEIGFIQADMTAFSLEVKFDACICALNSIQHLESDS
jgi:2-polyprenyl-3-methyl-5-hydroxy-6-metoxy-1,4-benzoquinol methylase